VLAREHEEWSPVHRAACNGVSRFEVDPTERPRDQDDAYVEARKSIFREAAKVDPEAYDLRRIVG
jgi:hypothetical protein